jgi:polyhydroxyalkanoate synthesis regulator phasin
MQEAVRTYLELALGLTEASRKRAKKVVDDVVGRGGATVEQARALTGDLLAMNSANRKALAKLVRFEVDRTLAKVGLASAEEVNELTARVRDLERQLRLAEMRAADTPTAADNAPAAASGTAATAAASRRPTLPEAGATKPPARKAPAKKAVAKKAVAKKAVAKKAPAAKATTRKAQP